MRDQDLSFQGPFVDTGCSDRGAGETRSALEYVVGGEGDPLLFLHGGGVTVRSYDEVTQYLKQSHRVYAANLPGHGRSDLLPSMDAIGQRLADFVFDHDLDGATVVGHSFGAGCAISLARCSDQVLHTIAADPMGVASKLSMPSLLYTFFIKKNVAGLMHDRHIARFHVRGFRDMAVNILRRGLRAGETTKMLIRTMYEDMDPFEPKSSRVLILWGEDDGILPVGNAEVLRGRISGARVMVVPGPHDWVLADAGNFGNIVRDFVAS